MTARDKVYVAKMPDDKVYVAKMPDDRSMLRKYPDNSIIEETFVEKKYEEILVRVFLEYTENEEGEL